jgi:ABC-2 type transport system permease protein
MGKIGIIIQREYLTRVRNKTFLLSTFLLPLVMILFFAGSTYFAVRSVETQKVAVANDDGFFSKYMVSDTGRVVFDFAPGVDSNNYMKKGYDAVLYPPDENEGKRYRLISRKQAGLGTKSYVERQLNKAIEGRMLEARGIDRAVIDSINRASEASAVLENRVSDQEGPAKQTNAAIAYGIGFGSGMLIYITMFIFGSMVMRGVAEEKVNRIAEVIVSSCKPFELMLGKIIGIAGVGLTQFLLWIVLIFALSQSLTLFIPAEVMEQAGRMQAGAGGQEATAALKILQARDTLVSNVNWPLVIGCFLFYFLGGYLFYASLFAAIGSVINEDPQEAQALMLPISMPIIFAIIILGSILDNPGSPLAVWTSMIPFTSPIVMMARIAFGVPEAVPVWQLLLSMALLVLGFLFTVWFAGKVYRVGILLYGKKVTWKEMARWAFRKA